MSAKSLRDLDDTRRRNQGRSRPHPTRFRDRLARVFRRGADRRQEALLRANPHLARDVGLELDDPILGRPR
ncbi:hypothetical protein [Antarctobacter jejuensis]|uniref:hypothetical protein n=1 Tax=Antarctobacter jejuensis TaxID=1439938 RepID=UPI003FD3ED88